jgi:polyphosphate kinase
VESPFVQALIAAARAGKEVTAVVELRARFDEEANIELTRRLEDAGTHLVYGVVGHKTHAKMILVVRREGGSLGDLQHYVHLGTGNYHVRTARLYTDYGLFTCDPHIGEDVHKIFLQLTSLGKGLELSKILYSPFTLHAAMVEKIGREMKHRAEGRESRIVAKMNQLTEPEIIRELYRASGAGVPIDLIVRGMCSLRPGIPGLSEHITVRSIVGRFLEHTRVFYFHNGGDPEIFCSSADWMPRNFFHRVETCFPVEREKLKKRILRELEWYLKDNRQAWLLGPDGYYRLRGSEGEEPFSAQESLLREGAEVVTV